MLDDETEIIDHEMVNCEIENENDMVDETDEFHKPSLSSHLPSNISLFISTKLYQINEVVIYSFFFVVDFSFSSSYFVVVVH